MIYFIYDQERDIVLRDDKTGRFLSFTHKYDASKECLDNFVVLPYDRLPPHWRIALEEDLDEHLNTIEL